MLNIISLSFLLFTLFPDLQQVGAECQAGSVDMKSRSRVVGQEVRRSRQSGTVLSSGAEAGTLRSSRISVRRDNQARRQCDVGRTFLFKTLQILH